MDPQDAIRQLEPGARAILALFDNLEKIAALEQDIDVLEAEAKSAEERFHKANASYDESLAKSQQAKAEVIEAQANCDRMVSAAKVTANSIIEEAKASASAEVETIKKAHSQSIAVLANKVEQGKAELKSIQESIAAKRQDHDAVLASIASLKNRLGAA